MKQKLLSILLLCTLLGGTAFAQSRTISGTVTSAVDGLGLPGVTVTVRGTNVGAQTNAAGTYTLSVPSSAKILEFSYLGFVSQVISIGEKNTINVTLASDAQELGEVVITAMGVQRSARSAGYAVSKVDPDLVIQKSEPDMLKGLQGKVAGVDIRTSQGTPGAATRIQIRGNSSFYGDNQPLIVVDGVPYSNDQVTTSSQTSGGSAYSSGISNLDPNDILSMNVLKGSAAGALYGSRASNGVVLITTKSGNASRTNKGFEVTYKSSASMETIANLPTYQNKFGAGANFNYSNSNGSWGPAFADRETIPVWPDYQAAYPELFPDATIPYQAYPNNVKDLFETGAVFENSISINGGDEKSAVSLTASQVNHNGYVPNSEYKRSNISLGGSTKLENGLNVRGNLAYTTSDQVGGFFGENQVDGAASQFARSLFLARNWDLNLPYEDKLGNNLTPLGAGQFDNPHWSSKYNTANTKEERIIANMHLDYAINDWIQLDYNLGVNTNALNRREVYEISSRAAEGKGRLILDSRKQQEIESTFLATFNPEINEELTLRAVFGINYNQRTINRESQTGNEFITRGIHRLTNTSQQIFNNDSYTRRRLFGTFIDATLGYRDYAFLNVTGRNDWSSTLPVNSRSYFYPAVSGSLVFSDALELNSDFLNYGKIRAGWAKVGRDTDPYSLMNTFDITSNFLGQSTGRVYPVAYDPNLTPEFTTELELGTDLGFLNNRVEFGFTWYDKNSTGLLAGITAPPSSGYSELFTNYGKINNKGIELELRVRPLPVGEVNWTLSGTFTKNKNIVKELIDGTDRIPLRGVLTGISPYLEPDLPFGYLRGTKSLRDDEGNLLINPATGALIEDELNEHMIGDPSPKFKLGINNAVSYKGFFLTALFDFTKGGSVYSVTNSSLLGRGVSKDTEDRQKNAVIEGVYGDPITREPILDANGNKIPNQTRLTVNDLYFSPNATLGQTFAINTASEWNVYDATVYHLREVSFGYELPKSLFKNTGIGSMVLSVTGRNLWHLAPNFPKYSNFDPEVASFGASSTQGIELSAAPTTKRYGFNLVVTF